MIFQGDSTNYSSGYCCFRNLADLMSVGITRQTYSSRDSSAIFRYDSEERKDLRVFKFTSFSMEYSQFRSLPATCLTQMMLCCLMAGEWLLASSQAWRYYFRLPSILLCLTRLSWLDCRFVLIRLGYSLSYIIINVVSFGTAAIAAQSKPQSPFECKQCDMQGRYAECSQLLQQVLNIYQNQLGHSHPSCIEAADKLCQAFNLAAMKLLEQDKLEASLDFLKRAENIVQNTAQSKATTFNNMACYYRRTGKLRAALSYLIQALGIELKLDKPRTLADTHLNICAVLSQLNRHDQAHQHAMLSIILVQDELLKLTLDRLVKEDNMNVVSDDRLAVLAVAYHNLGVQLQHLQRTQESIKIYNKALKIAVDYVPHNKPLIRNLGRVVNSVSMSQHEPIKEKVVKNIRVSRDMVREKSANTTKYNTKGRGSVIQSENVNKFINQASSFMDSSRPQPKYRIYKSKITTPSINDKSMLSKMTDPRTHRESVQESFVDHLKDL